MQQLQYPPPPSLVPFLTCLSYYHSSKCNCLQENWFIWVKMQAKAHKSLIPLVCCLSRRKLKHPPSVRWISIWFVFGFDLIGYPAVLSWSTRVILGRMSLASVLYGKSLHSCKTANTKKESETGHALDQLLIKKLKLMTDFPHPIHYYKPLTIITAKQENSIMIKIQL